jgi:hypothetical protein
VFDETIFIDILNDCHFNLKDLNSIISQQRSCDLLNSILEYFDDEDIIIFIIKFVIVNQLEVNTEYILKWKNISHSYALKLRRTFGYR